MGKASRNARSHLTKTFARLQNSGKSIFEIAAIAKSDPLTVFLHFSPDGDGRRRNEGFVSFLRKNGAHWSLIAAAQGMAYDEIKRFDSTGTRPSGQWLQGIALVGLHEESPEVGITDELPFDAADNDEEISESEVPDSPEIMEDSSGKAMNEFIQGQKVHLTEDSMTVREELLSFSGEVAVIVHINGNQILIRKVSDYEDEKDPASYDHQMVSPDEITSVIDVVEPNVGDEVIYTKVGEASRPAKILTMQNRDGAVTYSLILMDDSSYTFASPEEIKDAVSNSVSVAVNEKFYLKENGCDAVGIADDHGGITVLRESKGKRKISKGKNDRENILNDRLELFEDAKVKINGDVIELVEDHYFKSFYRAASGLMGYTTSGQKWKTLDGRTYTQIKLGRSPEELFGV